MYLCIQCSGWPGEAGWGAGVGLVGAPVPLALGYGLGMCVPHVYIQSSSAFSMCCIWVSGLVKKFYISVCVLLVLQHMFANVIWQQLHKAQTHQHKCKHTNINMCSAQSTFICLLLWAAQCYATHSHDFQRTQHKQHMLWYILDMCMFRWQTSTQCINTTPLASLDGYDKCLMLK